MKALDIGIVAVDIGAIGFAALGFVKGRFHEIFDVLVIGAHINLKAAGEAADDADVIGLGVFRLELGIAEGVEGHDAAVIVDLVIEELVEIGPLGEGAVVEMEHRIFRDRKGDTDARLKPGEEAGCAGLFGIAEGIELVEIVAGVEIVEIEAQSQIGDQSFKLHFILQIERPLERPGVEGQILEVLRIGRVVLIVDIEIVIVELQSGLEQIVTVDLAGIAAGEREGACFLAAAVVVRAAHPLVGGRGIVHPVSVVAVIIQILRVGQQLDAVLLPDIEDLEVEIAVAGRREEVAPFHAVLQGAVGLFGHAEGAIEDPAFPVAVEIVQEGEIVHEGELDFVISGGLPGDIAEHLPFEIRIGRRHQR